MPDDSDYEGWLNHRRSMSPSSELLGRIMSAVSHRETARRVSLLIRIGLWVEQSRVARCAACAAALLVGSMPFLFLAHVAQLIVF
ncbi:MAG: hypothetical protein H6822_07210 [Planctomycetaceae bacterium]|nr:hypothetical protein [Planctomycetales bacterium]MCB9921951.1 hypothetical protein [Planctomycetaceae bacterium]